MRTLLYIITTIVLCSLLLSCFRAESKAIQQPNIALEERCALGNTIRCLAFNLTEKTITLDIENLMDYEMEIKEIKIYEAGTCGNERLNRENFPQKLPPRSRARIELVCNAIPEQNMPFNSEIILRYYTTDFILHTEKGNMTGAVRPRG